MHTVMCDWVLLRELKYWNRKKCPGIASELVVINVE